MERSKRSKERTNQIIELTFDFLRQLVKNPDLIAKIPSGSQLEFIKNDFSTLKQLRKQQAF